MNAKGKFSRRFLSPRVVLRARVNVAPGAFVLASAFGAFVACSSQNAQNTQQMSTTPPPIIALNAFYYYRDLAAAESFYTDIIGLETVSDFGFAKILQVAPASYLTLVDADSGMHGADEPKTVTLALVTEQVEGWYDHLSRAGVPMRAELRVEAGRPHDGFVAIDPEGYLIEVERFNVHEENEHLVPRLEQIEPLTPSVGGGQLTISATVLWLYYDQLPPVQAFYERILRANMIVDQGWAKVYGVSPTGLLGLVDGARGLHRVTDEKGVTVSFVTEDIEGWFAYLEGQEGFDFRTHELGEESGRVRTLVGYDLTGYFLEWDQFLNEPGNERLMELLH